MPKDVPAADLMVGVTEIAAMAGRTVRWVQLMAKDGHFEKGARGQYRLGSVIAGLVGHYEALLEKGSRSAAATEATQARAEEIRQRMAMRDRTLIPIEDATMALDQLAGVVNGELSGLPARISRDMTVRKKAEAEVHASKERISTALTEAAGAARTGRGLDEAGADSDA